MVQDENTKVENKKNYSTLLYIIISILIVIILILVIYLAYDNGIIFSKKTNEKDTSETQDEIVENNETDNNEIKLLSHEEALSLGNELWNYANDAYWGDENVWKRHNETNEYGGQSIICDTTKEEVKTKFSPNFTYTTYLCDNDSCISNDLNSFLMNECQGAGRGGNINYKGMTFEVKNIEENKITYRITVNYTDGNKVKDFVIEKINDNWLIETFYLPY